jgi:AraC-like DNA-binding protein
VSEAFRIDGAVPAGDRVGVMGDMCAEFWVPMETSFDRPCERVDADTVGEFRAAGVGAMRVVVMDLLPLTVRRTSRHISRAAPDLLKACLVCGGGQALISQDGRQALLQPGDFGFYDTRQPYEVAIGTEANRPLRVMTFMFSPSLLPLRHSGLAGLTATRIPASAGIGQLTSQFLRQLARNVDHYTDAEAARLSSAALEVLATRLSAELDAGGPGTPEDRRHALLTTVQGFISQHLGDPQLSPAAVAAAHHMSLRALHQLFHDAGLTVAGYIRARRLAACRRDLADPSLDSRPVAAIAARWGFSSAADFSRAFRSAHGVPPAQYRRSALVARKAAV